MNDIELAERTFIKLDCVVKEGLHKGMPITRQAYRAVPRPHGFSTCYWDYRRRPNGTIGTTYAFDLLIIGQRTSAHVSIHSALSKVLQLPMEISQSIDCGFQGCDFSECYINRDFSDRNLVDFSRRLFDIGSRLRDIYRSSLK